MKDPKPFDAGMFIKLENSGEYQITYIRKSLVTAIEIGRAHV